MKAWEIVGWVYEDEIYCSECCSDMEDAPPEMAYPIFASDEGWEDEVCSECSCKLGDLNGDGHGSKL